MRGSILSLTNERCTCGQQDNKKHKYLGICRCSKDGKFYEMYQCDACKKTIYQPYSGAIDTVEYRR